MHTHEHYVYDPLMPKTKYIAEHLPGMNVTLTRGPDGQGFGP